MKKTTLYLLIIGGVLLLTIFSLVWIIAGPSGPIILSKQTTYLTGPLNANGLIDYERAILEMQAANVEPQENAAIPYLQAMWPCELTPEEQAWVCNALQMSQPSQHGMVHSGSDATLDAVTDWLNQQQAVNADAQDLTPLTKTDALVAVGLAYWTPWTREQLPPLADWLDQQAPHFAKLHEINERPKYFLPSPSFLNNQSDAILNCLMQTIQAQREAARCLSVRAMLHVGENRPRKAWEDMKTLFVLSRCHSRPGFLVELLVSAAVRGMACGELQVLLSSGQCDAQLLGEIEQFLAQLQPFDEMALAIGTTERMMGLDAAVALCTQEGAANDLLGDADQLSALAHVPFDRNAMLVKLNEWYDRMVVILEIKDLNERQAAADQLEIEIETMAAGIKDPSNLAGAIFNQSSRGEWIAQFFGMLLLPAVTQAGQAEERLNLQVQLLRVAVALELMKAESGDYPASLDALANRIDPLLLQDPYSGDRLHYEQRAPGYLLYSIFMDRKDDGGTSTNGDIEAGEWLPEPTAQTFEDGDMVIRFPQPQKKFLDPPPWEVAQDEIAIELEVEEQPSLETASPSEE
ncbi:hypothetical protein [Blastopirellula marina]|uniref:Uncharacterized protein n=1 Tax=Blastopirellula marina DSM 3645 TaxID=314230 RepID=A3ZRT6_9BACT|nr:hypothetical protein [Blastopirellula marina]EAQ80855.1 hypothetical protein DSM3645_12581 [Blastopirellula marina DSM 3645]